MARTRRSAARRPAKTAHNYHASPEKAQSTMTTSRTQRNVEESCGVRLEVILLIMCQGTRRAHFTLVDEARNTDSNKTWRSDSKLRHAQISFIGSSMVSSRRDSGENDNTPGGSFPNKLIVGPSLVSEGNDLVIGPTCTMISNVDDIQSQMASTGDPLTVDPSSVVSSSEATQLAKKFFAEPSRFNDIHRFFVSATAEGYGQAPVDMQNPYTRCSISSDGSNSSEDVVLFSGRTSLRPIKRSSFVQDLDSELNQSRLPPFGHSPKITPTIHRSHSGTGTLGPTCSESAGYLGKSPEPRVSQRLSKRSRQAIAVQADYIANLRDHVSNLDDSSVSLRARNIDDDANDVWESTVEGSVDGKSAYFASAQRNNGTTPDTDHVSTSSDPQHNNHQLSSTLAWQLREQSSGAPEGEVTPDDRWSTSSWWCKNEYSRVSSEVEANTTSPRRTKDAELNEPIPTERHGRYESIGDQHDPFDTVSTDMTDEQIAIRLTKQDELGLGSSNILLFGGDENFLERRHFDDRVFDLRATGSGALASGNRGRLQKGNDNRTKTINKSVSHQVYNSFNIVDRERQSLSRGSKGHRATRPIMLSDSDLENSMQRAWVGDRRKKKERKQAREEMRAQGRLGNPGKPGLRSRPSGGTSLDQVKDKIREFLLSDDVM